MNQLQIEPRTILIIDDNIINLRVAVDYLKAYGFEILIAHDGITGIERAQLAQPNLILLDVQMLEIDGFETCRRLKAIPQTAVIPIIFMTALGDASDRVRGLEVGAVDYVVKPIEEAELLARVNTHITLTSLQNQLQSQNQQLEELVRQRTADLQEEIAQRKQQQVDKNHLFDLVQRQSQQLRDLTSLFAKNQSQQNQNMAQIINEQIDQELLLLEMKLKQVHQMLDKQQGSRPPLTQATEELVAAQDILRHIRQQTQQVGDDLVDATTDNHALLKNPLLNLSTREHEVLQLLAEGKSNTNIAKLLIVSRSTVSTYRKRIMDKLDIHDFPALVQFALQHNLI